ncbi:SpoVG family protein [Planctomycetes bacterium K23_9]|uniref:Septation protein SpoVG n=1 Tax=Stieleria marina TaxID=1930275 RepID=A0A517P2P5_9BACT|nr:Putative septation protein SpoVG [Planctomycetes bacterium K23_9]
MEITEIRIKLMESSEDRLRAFCSITIDGSFVVRDLKIIDGTNGPFVAMPSRKLSGHCQRCHHKNHLRAAYCNNCGIKLQFEQSGDYDSPQKLYADVAHPINSECREMIQNAVIEEFQAELRRSNEPGYRSRYDDDFDQAEIARAAAPASQVFVDPAEPKSKGGGAPRPKFIDKKERDTTSADSVADDSDGFGEGIF